MPFTVKTEVAPNKTNINVCIDVWNTGVDYRQKSTIFLLLFVQYVVMEFGTKPVLYPTYLKIRIVCDIPTYPQENRTCKKYRLRYLIERTANGYNETKLSGR